MTARPDAGVDKGDGCLEKSTDVLVWLVPSREDVILEVAREGWIDANATAYMGYGTLEERVFVASGVERTYKQAWDNLLYGSEGFIAFRQPSNAAYTGF